jgi:hypothetical protein
MEQATIKIRPRTLPRDFVDVLIAMFVCLPLQVVPMFFLPAGLVWWLTGSFLWGFVVLLAIYAAWLCFTVWSVELSADGVRFIRLFGTPRFLRWDEITTIAEAPRREVVLHGWLWPLFPPRELTPALSALGHFRIRWSGGWCYFPPSDTETFKKEVDEFRNRKAG